MRPAECNGDGGRVYAAHENGSDDESAPSGEVSNILDFDLSMRDVMQTSYPLE